MSYATFPQEWNTSKLTKSQAAANVRVLVARATELHMVVDGDWIEKLPDSHYYALISFHK